MDVKKLEQGKLRIALYDDMTVGNPPALLSIHFWWASI
jgi:hypothetical protein